MTTFTDNKDQIFRAVSEMYAEVSACPSKAFHFPTGRPACLYVGYPVEQMDAIPATAVESFAGVNYPWITFQRVWRRIHGRPLLPTERGRSW